MFSMHLGTSLERSLTIVLLAAAVGRVAAPGVGASAGCDCSVGLAGRVASWVYVGRVEHEGGGGVGAGWVLVSPCTTVSLCKPAHGSLAVPRRGEVGWVRPRGPGTRTPAIRSAFLWRDMAEVGSATDESRRASARRNESRRASARRTTNNLQSELGGSSPLPLVPDSSICEVCATDDASYILRIDMDSWNVAHSGRQVGSGVHGVHTTMA